MTNSPTPQTAAERAKAIRKARARRWAQLLAIGVILPTIAGIIYYGLWTADQYESVAVFTIQAPAGHDESVPAVPTRGKNGPTMGKDDQLLREIIRSRAMLDRLAAGGDLAEHYSHADIWSRLSPGTGSEETYDYYLDKVHVSTASAADSLTLRVRAFAPHAARDFALRILEYAEEMLNDVVARSFASQKARAVARAQVAGTRAHEARREFARLTASTTSDAGSGRASATDPRSPRANATDPRSPRANEGVEGVEGVRRGDGDERSAALVAAEIENELAERAWRAALETVDRIELERERAARYVVLVSAPSLPDQPTYPRRAWGVLTVFIVALALIGVLSLLTGAVREHAKF